MLVSQVHLSECTSRQMWYFSWWLLTMKTGASALQETGDGDRGTAVPAETRPPAHQLAVSAFLSESSQAFSSLSWFVLRVSHVSQTTVEAQKRASLSFGVLCSSAISIN